MTLARKITVVGASRLGCDFALKAAAAGHEVTLIDEHPQDMGQMAFDAPWFYGSAIPAAVANANAVAQSVLEGSPALASCFEAGIDVRVGTVAWGAFQNVPNSQHIGPPKVGLVDAEGNAMLEHDALAVATGHRDFVPSFRGSDLPGVFGVKAGLAWLDLYRCYEGKRTLVLGTSARAVEFARRAMAAGVEIVGMIEPSDRFQAGKAAAAEIAGLGIPVHFATTILGAEGRMAIEAARLCAVVGGDEAILACDSICCAIAVLPNIELPAAMGCRLRFDTGAGLWLPETDAAGRTSLDGVLWLSDFVASDVDAALAALAEPAARDGKTPPAPPALAGTLRTWVAALLATGGGGVTLCKCEEITRDDFLGLRPPPYLGVGLRHPQSPVSTSLAGPTIHQDQLKRLTRVGMGHCQGKRCRDEAAILLSVQFGTDLETIRPGSYRFPVRPVALARIAAEEPPGERWSYWLHEPEFKVEE
ncbi:FAD-dependent oxidoreductase [Albidovulum sp.]|uniref:FAD-dependent oxidoreductase n=1 Tax=Albidovulum sp. TaxID=1872424 RepID=UPI0039B8A314